MARGDQAHRATQWLRARGARLCSLPRFFQARPEDGHTNLGGTDALGAGLVATRFPTGSVWHVIAGLSSAARYRGRKGKLALDGRRDDHACDGSAARGGRAGSRRRANAARLNTEGPRHLPATTSYTAAALPNRCRLAIWFSRTRNGRAPKRPGNGSRHAKLDCRAGAFGWPNSL